jgi:N-formylglutamate deformylase
MESFARAGFSVSRDDPFAGALVPAFAYRTDPRVKAIMVEVNRRLYLDERDASKLPAFGTIAQRVRACCIEAIEAAMSSNTV